MTFKFSRLEIPDVMLIQAEVMRDRRGHFFEAYKWSAFRANMIPGAFVQDNYSYSIRGVIRGLHYQMRPKAQGKLISVIQGEIYDVAVDVRVGSPTYGSWVGASLSADEHQLVFIPAGFAHGFQVISDEALVAYKVTSEYAPEAKRGIAWNDPTLAIPWPIGDVILSQRDAELPLLAQAETSFIYDEDSA